MTITVDRRHRPHARPRAAGRAGDRVRGPHDHLRRARRAVEPARPGARGRGRRATATASRSSTRTGPSTSRSRSRSASSTRSTWRSTGGSRPAEIAEIINDARAKVLIVGPEFVAARREDRGRPRDGVDDRRDRRPRPLARLRGVPGRAATRPIRARSRTGDDVAFQLYTSGTTGLPKGVMLTNDNFFDGVVHVTDSWRFTPDSVNLAVMPMFHIAGAGWSMVGLYHGCQTVLLRDVDPARILERRSPSSASPTRSSCPPSSSSC